MMPNGQDLVHELALLAVEDLALPGQRPCDPGDLVGHVVVVRADETLPSASPSGISPAGLCRKSSSSSSLDRSRRSFCVTDMGHPPVRRPVEPNTVSSVSANGLARRCRVVRPGSPRSARARPSPPTARPTRWSSATCSIESSRCTSAGSMSGRPRSVEALPRQLGVVAQVGEELRLDGASRDREVPDLAVERIAFEPAAEDAAEQVLLVQRRTHQRGGNRAGIVEQVHLARAGGSRWPAGWCPCRSRRGASAPRRSPSRGCRARGSPSGRAGTPGCCTS